MARIPSPRVRGEARRHLAVPATSGRRSRNEGEGAWPDEPDPEAPPHRRLPPRRADDEVGTTLSPQAGRGDAQRSM
ncbi:hypothetical protein FV218_18270 [Methylobacterium sp. WL69]|nr:hypothetical protein FV218_18270 [Methylobacterium sp. WL69]